MHYKRSKVLINKKFQLKFAFFVCSWIFALSMIYPLIIYNLFEYFIRFANSGSTASAALSVAAIQGVETQVLILLGILQLIFLGITFILTLFLSHRIAGPLFKLKRAIDETARGNYNQQIVFRKNDHFLELQESFNDMIRHISVKR